MLCGFSCLVDREPNHAGRFGLPPRGGAGLPELLPGGRECDEGRGTAREELWLRGQGDACPPAAVSLCVRECLCQCGSFAVDTATVVAAAAA